MPRLLELKRFQTTSPYASEIFGVYQPLLGWKSDRVSRRFDAGFERFRSGIRRSLAVNFTGLVTVEFYPEQGEINVRDIRPGVPGRAGVPRLDGVVLTSLQAALPPLQQYQPEVWDAQLSDERIQLVLTDQVRPYYSKRYVELWRQNRNTPDGAEKVATQIRNALDRESAVAGALVDFRQRRKFDVLKSIFYGDPTIDRIDFLHNLLDATDPFALIDPKKDLPRVALSPLGVVHLFRQYFFEFDTFLGTPVGHVWLSPGSTVELVEISTRKSMVERLQEELLENIVKTETATTALDELSDAVKQSNRSDMSLGMNANASQQWSIGGLGDGSASASASFDLKDMQEKAREDTHKRMRQQSDKLSTEIRRNFKSTLKTVSEVTDTSSKRYVLTNSTPNLINYELRRKMRRVGVQVQDIGNYLCWQTYVDEAGRELGVAGLVHLSKSPDLSGLTPPQKIMPPPPIVTEVMITIPFVGKDTDDNDMAYTNGSETEVADVFDSTEHIEADFPQTAVCSASPYLLKHVDLDASGADAKLSISGPIANFESNKARFTIHLDYVHFHGRDSFPVKARLYWEPVFDQAAIDKANTENLTTYTAKQSEAERAAYVAAARERIKLAGNIVPRRFEDLREEERIVVYRQLIASLLKNVPLPDNTTRHAAAELLNSIFDVNKMLYFVAPEWWKPRTHFSTMQPGRPLSDADMIGWQEAAGLSHPKYHITEESPPARMGSSLGWLLQLDGDNLRNAFLNAPWVKAVIPIRPGKERTALNWLQQVEGTNGIGPGDMYAGDEPGLAGKTMLQALEVLANRVADKHDKSKETQQFGEPGVPLDDDNSVFATPIDKVYEHGFYLLTGGFRAEVQDDFEVFDQWVEVLPTDQVAAVEVKYDPLTGRQIQ